MNKVVCNICGTSYPENAVQCPICGFAHSPENTGSDVLDGNEIGYKHVKGGRYSKANVRKRNSAAQVSDVELLEPASVSEKPKKKQSRVGLIVIVIVLLLAILVSVAYIALRFFIPNDFLYEGTDDFTLPISTETTQPSTQASVEEETPAVSESTDSACISVTLTDTQITLTEAAQTYQMLVTLDPADTTDTLNFVSSDPTVATIDNNGVVTAVADGTALITVTCGNARAECTVVCTLSPAETESNTDGDSVVPEVTSTSASFTLNRRDITFDMEGQSWVLYDGGTISVSDIIWSSDDASIASITDGKVVAVADGVTTVHGSYGEQTVSCIIRCQFDSEGSTNGNSGVSEAGGDASRSYALHNPYGLSDDVTIHVGEQFPLMLVDENENKISDAQWSVSNTGCCTYESETVKGIAIGTTEISATYEGTTYTCIVRVVE